MKASSSSVQNDTDVRVDANQAKVYSVDADKNKGITQLAIGGIVGAVVGIAVTLADKKTDKTLKRTAKDLQNAVKGATEGVNKSVKNGVKTIKTKVNIFNKNIGKNLQKTSDKEPENLQASVEVAANQASNISKNIDTVENQADKISNDVQIFQLYEERLVANKKQVKTGEVAIAKHTETHVAQVSIPLQKERLIVEQILVEDGIIAAPGEADFNQRELAKIEIYEQTAEIEKQAFVREEIKVRKEVEQTDFEVEDEIRREELNIDIKDNEINSVLLRKDEELNSESTTVKLPH